MSYLNSGGGMMKRVGKCIGTHGGNFAFQRVMVAWDFEISTPLTWPCWLNNVGDL